MQGSTLKLESRVIMKATITFDLPEEQEEYKICNNAVDYYHIICEIENQIRSFHKYHNDENPEKLIQNIENLLIQEFKE